MDVRVERVVPQGLGGGVGERRELRHAGVDEDDVQLDVLLLQRGCQALGLFDAAGVVAQCDGAVADSGSSTGQSLLITAGDDDASAFMGVALAAAAGLMLLLPPVTRTVWFSKRFMMDS